MSTLRSPPSSPAPHPDLSHFLSIPWTRHLLTSPSTTIIPTTRCRELKPDTEDQLFSDTFATPDTIRAMLSYHVSPPQNTTGRGDKEGESTATVSTLFDLGHRLNGYAGVVHGGVVVTIIDESMGIFLSRNQELGSGGMGQTGMEGNEDMMTGELKVRFLRPVRTPGVVRVDVRMGRVEGRKYFVEAEMSDGEGERLATGEGVWIGLKGKAVL